MIQGMARREAIASRKQLGRRRHRLRHFYDYAPRQPSSRRRWLDAAELPPRHADAARGLPHDEAAERESGAARHARRRRAADTGNSAEVSQARGATPAPRQPPASTARRAAPGGASRSHDISSLFERRRARPGSAMRHISRGQATTSDASHTCQQAYARDEITGAPQGLKRCAPEERRKPRPRCNWSFRRRRALRLKDCAREPQFDDTPIFQALAVIFSRRCQLSSRQAFTARLYYDAQLTPALMPPALRVPTPARSPRRCQATRAISAPAFHAMPRRIAAISRRALRP